MAREAKRAPVESGKGGSGWQALAWPAVLRSQALLAALIGALALLPRASGLADFLTTDEAYHWIGRVARFSAALAERNWAGTSQTGHPGVTIMWLGSLGRWLEGANAGGSIVEHLAWLRLPHAILEALLVSLGYLLLRRLVAPATALIAALLWAVSPYLIAHARLLHLDSLLTSFVTISLLLLLIDLTSTDGRPPDGDSRRAPGSGQWPLLASGFIAGLALLTKGPALILLPFVGLLLLLWNVPRERASGGPRRIHQVLLDRALFAAPRFAIWLTVALLTIVLLWPALWVDAPRVLANYVDEIRSNGGRPNGDGQFFLGQAVGDPGPLFYPVANLFRMTPAVLLGLLALPVAFRRPRTDGGQPAADDRRPRWSTERRVLLALGAFVLFWTIVMTIGPKKFDRYVLPTWPALCILAGAGLASLGAWATGTARPGSARATIPRLALVLLLAAELAQPALVHPYYLSYYNPLLGGGATAQRALLVGWGEGMDQVGEYLSGRPDASAGQVLSALRETLQPFVPVPVRDVSEIDVGAANYAVVYLESIQRGALPDIYARIRQTEPLHRITIHGIDYAEIYQLPKPFERPIEAQFGQALHLRGATIAREQSRLIVTPSWDVRARPDADYILFLHLLAAGGQRVAEANVAPGGDADPTTSSWEAGRQIAVPIDIALPPDLPPGDYRLTMGLFDPATGARLPLKGGRLADPALAGPDALLLETIVVR